MTRTFEDKPAVRSHVPLLIGLAGPSGGGKTFSALRLASGIQSVAGGDIMYIDTEAGRALHYADNFKFRHMSFQAPFGALDYLAAIEQARKKGAAVIIVDSMSHEHEGPGGLLEAHAEELNRLTKGDWSKEKQFGMLAWQKPKANRRRLINSLLQMDANFIFCFRAKSTVKPIKIEGKTEIVPMGFMPVAGEEFVFEMTLCALLLPNANGVPTWQSENTGERRMIKLPEQFKKLFRDPAPLSEDVGRKLAEWAKGDTEAPPVTDEILELARTASDGGSDVFKTFWLGLTKPERAAVEKIKDELAKRRAESDARQAAVPEDKSLDLLQTGGQ